MKIFSKNNISLMHSMIVYGKNNILPDEKFYHTYKNKINLLIEWVKNLYNTYSIEDIIHAKHMTEMYGEDEPDED